MIVSFFCHQVASTQVQPFNLMQQIAEFFFDMHEGTFQHIGIIFAHRVGMKAFYALGEGIAQKVTGNAQPRAADSRVIHICFHLGIFGVNA
ncbi:hypothetical protein D9M70_642490 [compost metagenome]